jgi:hypothetical protein
MAGATQWSPALEQSSNISWIDEIAIVVVIVLVILWLRG